MKIEFGSPKVDQKSEVVSKPPAVTNNYNDNRTVIINNTSNVYSIKNSSFPLGKYPEQSHSLLADKFDQYHSDLPWSGDNRPSPVTSLSIDSLHTKKNGKFYGQDFMKWRRDAVSGGHDGAVYKEFLIEQLVSEDLDRLDLALDMQDPKQDKDFWPNVLSTLCSGFYHTHYKNMCLIFPGGHRLVFNSSDRSVFTLFLSPREERVDFTNFEELIVFLGRKHIPSVPETLYVGALSPSGKNQLGQKGYRTQLCVYHKGKETGYLDKNFLNTLRFEFRFKFRVSDEFKSLGRKSFAARDLGLQILRADPHQVPTIAQFQFYPFLINDFLLDAITFVNVPRKARRRINAGTFQFRVDTIRRWGVSEWWANYLQLISDSDVNRVVCEDFLIALPLTKRRK